MDIHRFKIKILQYLYNRPNTVRIIVFFAAFATAKAHPKFGFGYDFGYGLGYGDLGYGGYGYEGFGYEGPGNGGVGYGGVSSVGLGSSVTLLSGGPAFSKTVAGPAFLVKSVHHVNRLSGGGALHAHSSLGGGLGYSYGGYGYGGYGHSGYGLKH
ncbi:hypothetical protein V5799_024093 [Amblyomma americanum]|uniref:Uncharacterized protein n=1 Tax=Amblyomma americanum TaxID=6943 RepID=A0AAQ4EDB3_AMBAM